MVVYKTSIDSEINTKTSSTIPFSPQSPNSYPGTLKTVANCHFLIMLFDSKMWTILSKSQYDKSK